MTWSSPATPVGGTAITVAFWNLNARDNLNHLRALVPDPGSAGKLLQSDGASSAAWVTPGTTFSAGMVMYWNASSASIPSGWAELSAARDRVIIGANNLYAYNATGGEATVNLAHSHTVNSHDHTITHDHGLNNHAHTITHDHSLNSHTHNIDHNHGDDGDGDGETGEPSATITRGSGGVSVATDTHTHWIPKFEGSTGIASGNTGGTNTANTGNASGNTAGTNTANSGTATPGTTSTLSATQSVLNPYLALTVMVKT